MTKECEVEFNARAYCVGDAVIECGGCSRRVCKHHGSIRRWICNTCARYERRGSPEGRAFARTLAVLTGSGAVDV